MRSLPNENGRRERPTVDLEDPQNARKLAGKNIDTVSEPCLGQPEFSLRADHHFLLKRPEYVAGKTLRG
jgi:hypothetical protein